MFKMGCEAVIMGEEEGIKGADEPNLSLHHMDLDNSMGRTAACNSTSDT